jgi:hypothetical protein
MVQKIAHCHDASKLTGATVRFDMALLPDMTNLKVKLQCCRPDDELVATPPQLHDCVFRLMAWSRGMSYIDEGTVTQVRGRLRRELATHFTEHVDDGEREQYTRIITALLDDVTTDANFKHVHAAALQLDAADRTVTSDVRMHPAELDDHLSRCRIEGLARYTTDELDFELNRRTKEGVTMDAPTHGHEHDHVLFSISKFEFSLEDMATVVRLARGVKVGVTTDSELAELISRWWPMVMGDFYSDASDELKSRCQAERERTWGKLAAMVNAIAAEVK